MSAFRLLSLLLAAQTTLANPDPVAAVDAIRGWTHGQDRGALLALESMENTAAPLAALLASDATPDAKKFAISQLASRGTAAQVPALAALLVNPEFASEAAGALGQIPGPESLAALRGAFAEAPPTLAASILTALAPRHDADSLPLFKAGLASDSAVLVELSTHALGRLASREALDALNAAKPNPALFDARLNRAITREDDTQLGDLSAPGRPAHIRRAAFSALVQKPEQDGRLILDVLAKKDPDLLAPAITALRDPARRDLLIPAAMQLATLPPAAQIQMLGVIADTGGEDLRPTVTTALDSPDPGVRFAAIPALGATGDGSSVPSLLKLLAKAADNETKAAIAAAIARLPGAGVNEALAADASADAIRALVARNATSAVPALLALAAKNDREAIMAVGRLGEAAAAPALISLLNTATDRAAVETALVSLGRKIGKTKFLVDALNGSASEEAKASMLNALAGLGGADALAALRTVLQQTEGPLRTAAVRAMAGMDNPAVLADLVAAAAASTDEKTRVLALRGVKRLEPAARKSMPAAELDALLEKARALTPTPLENTP